MKMLRFYVLFIYEFIKNPVLVEFAFGKSWDFLIRLDDWKAELDKNIAAFLVRIRTLARDNKRRKAVRYKP